MCWKTERVRGAGFALPAKPKRPVRGRVQHSRSALTRLSFIQFLQINVSGPPMLVGNSSLTASNFINPKPEALSSARHLIRSIATAIYSKTSTPRLDSVVTVP